MEPRYFRGIEVQQTSESLQLIFVYEVGNERIVETLPMGQDVQAVARSLDEAADQCRRLAGTPRGRAA